MLLEFSVCNAFHTRAQVRVKHHLRDLRIDERKTERKEYGAGRLRRLATHSSSKSSTGAMWTR
ncbi:hypothetical protein SALBM311S_00285 [Streptomyces alboniger]